MQKQGRKNHHSFHGNTLQGRGVIICLDQTRHFLDKGRSNLPSRDFKNIRPPMHCLFMNFVQECCEAIPISIPPSKVRWVGSARVRDVIVVYKWVLLSDLNTTATCPVAGSELILEGGFS